MISPAPLIGITTYAANREGEFTLPVEYVESVRRAGGLPLLITPGEPLLDDLVGWLDGCVFAGGGDIDPHCYGGLSHPKVYNVDPVRDEMELQLARKVLDRRLPALAICRGLQVVNIACGGTLHSHLPDHYGRQTLHRAPPREPVAHELQLDGDSRLAQILQSDRFSALSWHHQAIDRLPPGFRVVARAPDGVVEAVERPGHPELISIQWHPELTAAEDALQQRLFDELVRLARTASHRTRQASASARGDDRRQENLACD